MDLNEVSGSTLTAAAERVAVGLAKWIGSPVQREGDKAERSSQAREPKLEFIVEPLSVPNMVRPAHEPNALYVRLTAPAGIGRIAVQPAVGEAIAREVTLGLQSGRPIARAVLVGADSVVAPDRRLGKGHDAALVQLVAAIRSFTELGVPFVWRTRSGIDGPIPGVLASALVAAAAGPLGKLGAVVELGVPTLDASLANALEGNEGASPEQRLRLATALTSRGVVVRGLVDPLVPMLTDQQQGVEALMSAFAEAGVQKLGVRYVVLTRDRARTLASRLAGMQRALLQGVFADEPWHKPDPAQPGSGREVHKRIPSHLRRAGHHRLLEAGARHGIFVDILDPPNAGEDLAASTPPLVRGGLNGQTRPTTVRRRPQLELFRKSARAPR